MTKRKHKSHAPSGFNESLGKSLVNRRRSAKQSSKKKGGDKYTESPDATTKPELQSRTHESDMQEFLCNAELANANFEAEKGDVKLIASTGGAAIALEDFESRSLEELHAKYGHLLRIPRRPKPGTYRDAEELNALESVEFLEWRRQLAKLEEGSGVVVTPFERNLEIWRQLWRVVERSHVIVQVLDARNPLLFRSQDLERFVQEVDGQKQNMLLVNKADLLTMEQIGCWRAYFREQGIEPIFWSAKENVRKRGTSIDEEEESSSSAEEEEEEEEDDEEAEEEQKKANEDGEGEDEETGEHGEEESEDESNKNSGSSGSPVMAEKEKDEVFISSPMQLIDLFRARAAQAFPRQQSADGFVIGMVGYPNVGKSSTINRLLGAKKTSVSATPGKTKHFQTIIIDEQITLCDCPGLVMPSFGLSNAEMILNGILPINHMRDHFSPVQLLCNRVPRPFLQQRYSILLPNPNEEGPTRAHDLLTSVAFLKGFMGGTGIPDCSRAARQILTEVVQGSLKWCAAPPGVEQATFDRWTFSTFADKVSNSTTKEQTQLPVVPQKEKPLVGASLLEQLERRQLLLGQTEGTGERRGQRIDREFFGAAQLAKCKLSGIKGGIGRLRVAGGGVEDGEELKPAGKKHFNRNKREKLRRVFVATSY